MLIFLSLFVVQVASAALPSLQICATSQMVVDNVPGGKVYRCQTACKGDFPSCERCEQGLCQLSFVVDSLGGHLFYNPLPKAPTLIYFPGGGGTQRRTGIFGPMRKAGLKLVELQWEGGDVTPSILGNKPTGWYTKKSAEGTNLRDLSVRPAAVIQWVHDHLAEGQRFGTAGCSGGSVATFSALYFHRLDPILDYQWFGGGPYYDLGLACGAGPKELRLNRWALMLLPVDKLIDYIHGTGNKCQDRQNDPRFELSGPRTAKGDARVTHPVDFSVSLDRVASDEFLGISNQARLVFELVKGPKTFTEEKGWHCAAHGKSACRKICEHMLQRQDCDCQSMVLH